MKTDEQFTVALKNSQPIVGAVASWMQGLGCNVMIRPVVLRPNFDSRNEYADLGDIEISQRVEVKHRDIAFTSVDDYPFPTVFVDEKFKIERIKVTQLWGYVIVNRDCTHVCCIKPSTRAQWQVVEQFDSKDGQRRTFYACPKEHCTFHRMS